MRKSRILFVLSILILFFSITSFPTIESIYFNSFEMTSFTVEDDILYMDGLINSLTHEQLQKIVLENPQVTTIVMLDVPGSVDDDANLVMSKWVHDKGLNIHLTNASSIASGGVDFYLAGNVRTIDPGAEIGVHSWISVDGVEAYSLSNDHFEHNVYLEYFDYVNVSEDFYWYSIRAAPADDIHIMGLDEIERYGFITQ